MTDAAILAELIAERAQVATVCTEPAMIAFAGASAAKLLGCMPDEMAVVTCSASLRMHLVPACPAPSDGARRWRPRSAPSSIARRPSLPSWRRSTA